MSNFGWLRAAYWDASRPSELAERWTWLIVPSIIAYIPVIFAIQRFMAKREAYKLQMTIVFWNLALSILSGIGLLLFVIDSPHLLMMPMADPSEYGPGARAVWTIFCITKGIEFGDTVLLALRKRRVIFLHAYHHVTVALYSWHACLVDVKFAHACMCVNLAIHTVMYAYYAASAVNSRHPILVAMRPWITSSQTIQMFVGMYLSIVALGKYADGLEVTTAIWMNTHMCLWMYVSYAYLFSDFFIKNYVKNMRPIPTLVVTTIIGLAVAGSRMATKHSMRMRLVADVVMMIFGCLYIQLQAARGKEGQSAGDEGGWARRVTWFLDAPLALAHQEKDNGANSLLASVMLKTEKLYFLNETQWQGMVTSVVLPALWGAVFYSNWMLGICVHGCLRWCIEYMVGDLVFRSA